MHPSVAESLFVRKSARISGFFLLSLGAHAAAIALVVVLGLVNRRPPIDLSQKPIKASLVRLGTPRDKRLLPRKEETPPPPRQEEAPQPMPRETAQKEPSPAATVPSPAAKQQGNKQQEDTRRKLFGAFDRAGAKPKEVEGAADGDVLGDSAIQEGERYYGALRAQVRRYFFVSQTIPDQERIRLQADVLVRIGRAGELLEAKLRKSSGNDLFDSAVLTAVKRASPFAPPPTHLVDGLRARGVLMGFTPSELSP
jgi:TonB family protein